MKTFDLPITHNKLVTRADLAESLLQMLKPAAEHLNLGGGGLFIGNSSAHYSSRVALMEGWSRLLWGVAPFIAGGFEWIETYRKYTSGSSGPWAFSTRSA